MNQKELRRIVKEHSKRLESMLLRNVAKFPADWDGRHVYALAAMFYEYIPDGVKSARKEIKKSSMYYEIEL